MSNYTMSMAGRIVSAKRMSKAERANLLACIADCRATIDTGTDRDAVAWATIGLAECQAELLARTVG